MSIVPTIVKEAYQQDDKMGSCSFTANIVDADDFGNSEKTWFMKFGFNRKLYQKVNWEKSDATNLPKVAVGMSMNPVIMQKTNEEAAAVRYE